jgi:hypothetical protein
MVTPFAVRTLYKKEDQNKSLNAIKEIGFMKEDKIEKISGEAPGASFMVTMMKQAMYLSFYTWENSSKPFVM